LALIHSHFEVVVSFAETSGQAVDRTYVAGPSITTIAELAASWAIALSKVVAMSDSVVAGYTYKDVFIQDALTLPASAENNNQAIFTGKIIGAPNKSGTVTVPAIKPSLMVSPTGKGYDVVDTGDAVVIAFVNMFDSAVADGDWTISDGESWDNATVSGKRRNTKSSSS
jgi:hypothetical protein